MKVLHFKTSYLNQSETFINRLVRNHKDYEPVISTAFKKEYTEGLNIYEMPKYGIKGFLNRTQLKLNRSPQFLNNVILKEQPSVIHGHFALDSYRLLSVSRRNKIPLIVNFYGYDVMRLPKEFGWKTRYNRLKAQAAHYIAGSEDMKNNLTEMGFPEERIEVIKLGLDMDNISFRPKQKAGLNLMMVGRMVEKKGYEYALKAVSILKQKNYPVHIDLYGDGSLKPFLKDLCKALDIEDIVTFNGNTPNRTIITELYHHDILLIPSVQAEDGDREGIPQTIVEGMASGIPVIGSYHAGIPELVINGETGLLVKERDELEIAHSIIKLYKNPELVKRIIRKAKVLVKQEHCIHKMVSKTESLYNRVIQNGDNYYTGGEMITQKRQVQ
ncbi:MAG: glycosyltransferase [Balneolales bacterium]